MRRRAKLAATAVTVGTIAALLTGCPKTTSRGGQDPSLEKTDGQPATCSVAKDPLNPLVVEWPGTNKTELEAASQRGPVVVSYLGCVMKVLSGCTAGGAGSYALARVTPSRETLAIADESELKARLPLGVSNLGGELTSGNALQLTYVSVGQRQLARAPTTLSGQCAGATHYVRSLTVGAYELNTTSAFAASGGVELGGVGATGGTQSRKKRLRGVGDVGRCATGGLTDDEAASSCGAVLQLGLVPIDATDGKVAEAGFGEGLGTLTVIPKVGELRELSGGGSLSEADVELLKMLQAAKRADRGNGGAREKAAAWGALADYKGKNPYKDSAEQRRDQWGAVAEAERRRAEQVARVCVQYARDSAKLRELVALDDDVVSARQKDAYRRELKQVYAGWEADIPECPEEKKAREAAAAAAAERDRATGVMVFIPGGSFDMGSNDGREDEKPVHRVNVEGFSMDRTEVTVGAYRRCVEVGACSTNGLNEHATCNWGVSGKNDHPINCVDWDQSEAFCKWAGKRLPTEPEWEYAARGGSQGRKYAWGNDEPTGRACFGRQVAEGTCAVGGFPRGASRDGLLDMAGNVSEWTSTPFCKYNANGYETCGMPIPVSRGGGFFAVAVFLRGSDRVGGSLLARTDGGGFRCARTGR